MPLPSWITLPYEAVNPAYIDVIFQDDIPDRKKYRYELVYGGAGSGKSYAEAQKFIKRMLHRQDYGLILARKVQRSIRDSQFKLLCAVISDWNLDDYFRVYHGRLEIVCAINGNWCISKGLDKVEKLKSVFDPVDIWIEEATEISKRDMLQLDLRLRGAKGGHKQITMTCNPVNIPEPGEQDHWIYTRFIERQDPKAYVLRTTYRHNLFIDPEAVAMARDMARHDKFYYDVFVRARWVRPKHLVFDNVRLVSEMPRGARQAIYGVDFGFNDPTVLVECRFVGDDAIYIKLHIYESGITTADFIDRLKALNIGKSNFMFCDAANPERIQQLQDALYNAQPGSKNRGFGLDTLRSYQLLIDGGDQRLINEMRYYRWVTNANGTPLDIPIEYNDHCPDAVRYAIATYCKINGIHRSRRSSKRGALGIQTKANKDSKILEGYQIS